MLGHGLSCYGVLTFKTTSIFHSNKMPDNPPFQLIFAEDHCKSGTMMRFCSFTHRIVSSFDINICRCVLSIRKRKISFPTNEGVLSFILRRSFYVEFGGAGSHTNWLVRCDKYQKRQFTYLGCYDKTNMIAFPCQINRITSISSPSHFYFQLGTGQLNLVTNFSGGEDDSSNSSFCEPLDEEVSEEESLDAAFTMEDIEDLDDNPSSIFLPARVPASVPASAFLPAGMLAVDFLPTQQIHGVDINMNCTNSSSSDDDLP